MALVRLMHLRKLVPLGDLLDGGGRPAMAASRPRVESVAAVDAGGASAGRGAPRPAPAAPPPSRTRPASTASRRRAVGASRRVGRRAGPLPGRGQGRQAVLLQRRRRPGVPHRGRGRAHHLRVPRQPEGAAGAVRGESRVALGAGRAGPRPAGAGARHRGDARVRCRGLHAGSRPPRLRPHRRPRPAPATTSCARRRSPIPACRRCSRSSRWNAPRSRRSSGLSWSYVQRLPSTPRRRPRVVGVPACGIPSSGVAPPSRTGLVRSVVAPSDLGRRAAELAARLTRTDH